jgi:poly-beta-hydroxyalkanoate depolymerase
MTIAQLIIILILAAAWPYALETFVTWLQAAVPPPPGGAASQAYQLMQQVAGFMSQNAVQLSIASILVTAIVVAWRGRD